MEPHCELCLAPCAGGDGAPKSGMLAQIERGTFNLEAEMARLPEKGIASLRSDLAALEAECGEELRRSVYDNYKPFIEASQARPRSTLKSNA